MSNPLTHSIPGPRSNESISAVTNLRSTEAGPRNGNNLMKDSYYFSHDYNPRSDEKVKKLIRSKGMLGYGIFWAIIEDLYNNANALQTDYEGIAFDLHCDQDTVKSVINDFDLFVVKDGIFYSESVERRLAHRMNKSEKARESANYRWSKNNTNANAMQSHSERNAIKERKGKEKKENNNYTADFLLFWDAYPLKEGKKPAFAKWQKAKDKPPIEVILAKIELQKKTEKWQKKFIPMPETYINNSRWDDEIEKTGIIRPPFQQ